MPIIQEIPENHHHHHHPRHADNPLPPPAPPHQPHQNPKPNTNSGLRKLLFLFLKWIIMTFILSLFLIFIGFAALLLLHFLLTTTAVGGRRRHRQTHQSFSLQNPTTPLYSMEDLHGLLPRLNFSASEQTTRDCAICLEGFKEGELCRKLPDCSHIFHMNCVDNWLVKKPNCPVCRTRVQLVSGACSGSRNRDDDWKFWWPVRA